jgi:hypothetical protein
MTLLGVYRRSAALAVFTVIGVSQAHAGFVITPVWDSSINNDPNSNAIKSNINSVISLYESTFTDNINVKIYFQKGGGLGSSNWGYYYTGAGDVINHIVADAKTTDDAIAVSHLNTNGFGSIAVTSANGRALGYNTPGFENFGGDGGFDGAVSLNTDSCFLDHNSPIGGKFDLFSAAAHEINEVLGTPSGASGTLAFASDLYRYDGAGNRSFNGDTNAHAFFSIDGTTNITEYNQYQRSGGDWGDWIHNSPAHTQDWLIFDGIKIDPGEPEFKLLDVVGYDRVAPVPEPATLTVLGLGFLALIRRRHTSQ